MAEYIDMAVDEYKKQYAEAEGVKGTLTRARILREAKKELQDYYKLAKGEITGEYPYKKQSDDFFRKHEIQNKIDELRKELLDIEMRVHEYMA
jgi:hypothetical protein